TDGKGSGVDEADARTLTQLRVQVGHERNEYRRHQLDKARIAHLCRKLAAQMTLDILGVVGFERAVVRLLEQHDNGHDLDFDASGSDASALVALRRAASWCH